MNTLPSDTKSLQINGEAGQKLWREYCQLYYFVIIQIYGGSSKDLPTITNSPSTSAALVHLLAVFVYVKTDKGSK